jgi:muramoyltetrapeptide carboxypeptidase
VAVVSPSSVADSVHAQRGIELLSERYSIVWNPDCLVKDGYLAGPDIRRRSALQAAFDDSTIRAVIALRGGYGTTRLLNDLSFDKLVRSPKWIVGSSDLTGLLVQLWSDHRLLTIHGPMVAGFHDGDPIDLALLYSLLENLECPYPRLKPLYEGNARGPIIGGNLTVLAHLAGTISPDFARGAILFLEDVGERPYRIDRCLTQIKRAGFLREIAGIVLGEFTSCEPGPDGFSVEDVFLRDLASLNIPVATGYPAAHGKRNLPFFHGATAILNVESGSATLKIPPQ